MKLIPGSLTKRALMAGLIAGSGILAASTFAMTGGGPAAKEGCETRHGQQGHARWEARRAAHLSELKEKLKLSPGQEPAWTAFTSAVQPGVRPMGGDRQAMRGEFDKLNTPQRLDRMLALSETRRTRMLERSQAIKTFYAQLSPGQQQVFDAEFRLQRAHGGHRSQS